MRTKALAFLNTLSLVSYVSAAGPQFNPRSYDPSASKMATCDAIKRTVSPSSTGSKGFDVVDEERVQIQLHYVDINPTAGTTILMVHGWPADWSTWSYQIEEFKDDYRLIVPSLRGFGKSTHPENTRWSGTMFDVVNDLECILRHAGVEKAICMGHDWGSQVCYEAGRSRPDMTSAVIGVAIPYIPAANTFTPISQIVKLFPKMTYQRYFDEKTNEALEELGKDIRRLLRGTYISSKKPPPEGFLKSKDSFLGVYTEAEIAPIAFITPEEEDYLVEQFSHQGFKHTLQFYATENRYLSWKFAHDQGNLTLPQPVLTVYPTKDTVANWSILAWTMGTKNHIKKWTTETVTGGHWMHIENHEVFNQVVRKWLTKFREEEEINKRRPVDEL